MNIVQERQYRVHYKDVERVVSQQRNKRWEFSRATGHLTGHDHRVAVEYDLSHVPTYLQDLKDAGLIPERGILVIDLSRWTDPDGDEPQKAPRAKVREKAA
ncbi:MAG TPA: hypothetical protein VGG64_25760 [Pirellulales bacterium]|jgi:hypothetical protein